MKDSPEEQKSNKDKQTHKGHSASGDDNLKQSDPETDSNVTSIKKDTEADQNKQIRNDYLYLRAEFDNYKKNVIKERSDLIKYAGERLAYDLLNVLDIFDKALNTEVTSENFKSFKDGVELTASELNKTLEKYGIREIKSLGEKFDPNFHEALTQAPSDEYEPGTVIDVFKKGYKYQDKTLRPAQVVVSKEMQD